MYRFELSRGAVTHNQYMDETTPEERAWMVHIHRITTQIRAENEDRKAREITGGH